jgi:hypothetical protein
MGMSTMATCAIFRTAQLTIMTYGKSFQVNIILMKMASYCQFYTKPI